MIGVLYPLFLLLGFSIRNAFILDMVLAAIVAVITIYPEVLKGIKPIMASGWGRIGASFALAGLVLLILVVFSPMKATKSSIQIVSKDLAILPKVEETTVAVMKPPPPPIVKMERPRPQRETPTVVSRNQPSRPSNVTPVNFDRPPPPSTNPGSSLSNVRSVVGAPAGGFRAGEYDRAGNTTDNGEGFIYTWRPPFASTDVDADAVSNQEQQVVITRLKHTLSNYHVYDDSLRQLEVNLNSNNPEMRFSINLQQSFSPYGCILLIMGEDPQLASTSGRIIEDLTNLFTDAERRQLRMYVENGGSIIVMEATPFRNTHGFSDKMRDEVRQIFEDQWEKKYPIFFSGGDFIKEFNHSNDYSFLAGKLTAVLGKTIN